MFQVFFFQVACLKILYCNSDPFWNCLFFLCRGQLLPRSLCQK
jgi:hypothetical protein